MSSRAVDHRPFFEALLRADRRAAECATDQALAQGLTPIEVYEGVFRPALYEIGAMWERNELSVTAEHIATALTESEMTRLFPVVYSEKRVGRVALVASVEDEPHCVGARMVADCFEAEGWDTAYVGGDTPIADMLGFMSDLRPQAVALSVTLATRLPRLTATVAATTSRFPEPWVFVGGQAITHLTSEHLPSGPRVRVVPDLRELQRLIQWIEHAPGRDLPETDASVAPPIDRVELIPLVADLAALSVPGAEVADAIEAVADRLIIEVTDALASRPDIEDLVGDDGLEMMKQNHEHHLRFVASWLRSPEPALMVRTVVWVLRSYRAHGFSETYWPVQLEAWSEAFGRNLVPVHSAELRPLYRWLGHVVPQISEVLDLD